MQARLDPICVKTYELRVYCVGISLRTFIIVVLWVVCLQTGTGESHPFVLLWRVDVLRGTLIHKRRNNDGSSSAISAHVSVTVCLGI